MDPSSTTLLIGNVKKEWEMDQIFVAFSEYLNFIKTQLNKNLTTAPAENSSTHCIVERERGNVERVGGSFAN